MNQFRIRATGAVVSDSQLRALFPDTSFPQVLSASIQDAFGFDPVFETPAPATTAYQTANRSGVKLVVGKWVVDWLVSNWTPEQIDAHKAEWKARQWEAIKAERERRKSGGVLVGAHWFHSDTDSRIQWLGLKDQARDVLAAGGTTATVLQKLGQNVVWKTLSGTFVPVSVQLAFEVVNVTGDLDARLFAKAEQHNAAMEAATNPALYDFSTGWPAVFGE